MDVELIEDEPKDALEIAEGFGVASDVEEVSDEQSDVEETPAKVEETILKKVKPVDAVSLIAVPENQKADNVVEWLNESDESTEWTDNDSMSSHEPQQAVEAAPAKNVEKSSTGPVLEGRTVDKAEDKIEKREVSKEPSAKTDSSQEEPAQKSPKGVLKTALEKAARKHALDKLWIHQARKGKDSVLYRRVLPNISLSLKNLPESKEAAKSKQEETIAKLKNITKRSNLTIRKLVASTGSKITRIPETSSVIRIPGDIPQAPDPEPSTSADASKKIIAVPSTSQPLPSLSDVQIRWKAIEDAAPRPRIRKAPSKFRMIRPNFYRADAKIVVPASQSGNASGLQFQGIVSANDQLARTREFVKLAPENPICKSLETPQSFMESYVLSDQIKGFDSRAPTYTKHRSPEKEVQKNSNSSLPQERIHGTIRVKSNAALFNNPETARNNSMTTESPAETHQRGPVTAKSSVTVNDQVVKTRPLREKTPEPVKYVIPQDMLMSSTEKAKVITQKPPPTQISRNDATGNFADMFVMDPELDEEKKSTPGTSNLRHKRKSSIVLKNNDDTEFDAKRVSPPASLPPRPQENVDLIETLATYRVYVTSLLKKLGMPPMDFSEDSNDFINTYKIYRN